MSSKFNGNTVVLDYVATSTQDSYDLPAAGSCEVGLITTKNCLIARVDRIGTSLSNLQAEGLQSQIEAWSQQNNECNCLVFLYVGFF